MSFSKFLTFLAFKGSKEKYIRRLQFVNLQINTNKDSIEYLDVVLTVNFNCKEYKEVILEFSEWYDSSLIIKLERIHLKKPFSTKQKTVMLARVLGRMCSTIDNRITDMQNIQIDDNLTLYLQEVTFSKLNRIYKRKKNDTY